MGAISLKAQTWESAADKQFPFNATIYGWMSSACTTSVPAGIDTLNERWTGIIDITKAPFNADKTGNTDATKAFRDAFMHGYTFVYIPNGTYKLSDSVGFSPRWDTQNNKATYGFGETQIVMWGESRNGVKIVLKSGSTGFGSASTPKAFFNTGYGSPDRIGTSIHNVTFEIESGNPGAIGLRYYANNFGGMYNVTIRALGTSLLGLDKGFARANGPTLTKDVLIDGFQTGIKTGFSVESETYEHLILQNQTVRGWFNKDQILSIRDLQVKNCAGAALTNESGFINLLESNFQGSGAAAIRNGTKGKLLVRNLNTSGYTQAISDPDKAVSGTTISLYLSNKGLGPDGTLSDNVTPLNLTVKETPVIPWETDVTKWVDPGQFGATAMNGRKGVGCGAPTTCQPCDDDTKAIQDAIDATKPGGSRDGATTLFLSSTYRLYGTIHIRGSINRIISTGHTSFSFPYDGKTASGTALTGPAIIIDADAQPQIEFESVTAGAANHSLKYIENPYGKTVILKNCGVGPIKLTGGEAFFESISGGPIELNNVNTWAKAIDPENTGTKVTINGGNYWGLGLKTEQTGNVIQGRNRAKIEQFGAYLYSTHGSGSSTMFDIENSEISVSMTEYLGAYGGSFGTLVKDTKGSTLVTISRGTTTAPTYPANWSQLNDSTVYYKTSAGSCPANAPANTTCFTYNASLVGSEMLLYRNTSSTGAAENWITVDDNDASTTPYSISYSSGWTANTTSASSAGVDYFRTYHSTSTANEVVKFTFTGDRVEFYGRKRPEGGKADVYIDNTKVSTVDLYNSGTLWNQLIFQSDVLTAGTHELKIIALGTNSGGGSYSSVFIDAFAYRATGTPVTSITVAAANTSIETGGTTTVTATVKPDNATTKAVTWSSDNTSVATVSSSGAVTAGTTAGTANIIATATDGSGITGSVKITVTAASTGGTNWVKIDDNVANGTNYTIEYPNAGFKLWNSTTDGYYQNTVHYAFGTGSEAKFTFTGDKVRVYGMKRNNLGKADILIDGSVVGTIDQYSSTQQGNFLAFESAALSAATHTLIVRVTGTKSTSSSGTQIVIDAFEYNPTSSSSSTTPPPAASNGTGYTWSNMATRTSNATQLATSEVANGVLTDQKDVADNNTPDQWQAAGIIYSTTKSGINKVEYYNGSQANDGADNGSFTAEIGIQYTTNGGSTWTDATGWTVAPTYPYSYLAANQTYTFTSSTPLPSTTNGVRVVGKVNSNNNVSWAIHVREVKVYAGTTQIASVNGTNQQLQLNQNTVTEKITVFPNPVTDGWLTVGLTAADKNNKVDVSLSDLSGRIVYKSNFTSNGISERLNIGNVQAGVYVIRVTGSNTKFSAKVVVQ